MMSLQVLIQEVCGIACSSRVTNEDDLIRRSDVFRDLLIKRMLFGYAFAAVVRFLSMNQMMMKIERIVRFQFVSVCRAAPTEILVDVSGVVVDDNNHPAGLIRPFRLLARPSFLQKLAQSRSFLHAQVMGVRPLEKHARTADAKREFIVPMRLDLAQMLDQFQRLAPAEVMGQLALK